MEYLKKGNRLWAVSARDSARGRLYKPRGRGRSPPARLAAQTLTLTRRRLQPPPLRRATARAPRLAVPCCRLAAAVDLAGGSRRRRFSLENRMVFLFRSAVYYF